MFYYYGPCLYRALLSSVLLLLFSSTTSWYYLSGFHAWYLYTDAWLLAIRLRRQNELWMSDGGRDQHLLVLSGLATRVRYALQSCRSLPVRIAFVLGAGCNFFTPLHLTALASPSVSFVPWSLELMVKPQSQLQVGVYSSDTALYIKTYCAVATP